MSVVGIDFGNANCVVACVRQRAFEVVANEASRRETPCVVGFSKENVRVIGEGGATQIVGNLQNTVTNLKRIIGRKYNDKVVQDEIPYLPYKIKEVEDGKIGIDVVYNGEATTFSPEQVLAMILHKLTESVELFTKIKPKDIVLSVPGYYTDAQRRALRDASKIAGLTCLKLISEPAAVALHYASKIWKTGKNSDQAVKVMFIDMGQSALSVSVASYDHAKCKLVAAAFDENIGGRDFDRLLVNHFADEFQEKFKVNIRSNPKALFRLEQACEKAKNILTVNSQAPISIESIMNDVDVRGMISREKFEELAAPLLERVKATVQRALDQSGLKVEELYSIETAGNARIPCFYRACEQVLGHEVKHTLNKSECIANGATLQCAMLSPQCLVRDLAIQDIIPYSIKVSWGFTNDPNSEELEDQETASLYDINSPIPSGKKLTFQKSKGLRINVALSNSQYDSLPIGTFYIPAHVPKPIEGAVDISAPRVEIKMNLDQDGVFKIEYAHAIETYLLEADAPPAIPEGETPAEPSEEQKKKRKTRRTELVVQEQYNGGFNFVALQQLVALELKMRAQDYLAFSTAESKNNVESYVYDMRNKVQFDYCDLYHYATEAEREVLLAKLDETEAWLYDEGAEATKEVYDTRLALLKSLGDFIVIRHHEDENRPAAISSFESVVSHYSNELSLDDKYAHIAAADLAKIRAAIDSASSWLANKMEKQSSSAKHDNPVLLVDDIHKEAQKLKALADPILSRPKPAPPKEEPKSPAPEAKADAAPEAAAEAPEAAAAPEAEAAPAPEAEAAPEATPMETSE